MAWRGAQKNNMEYMIMSVSGRNHVVCNSERKKYVFEHKYNDKNGQVKKDKITVAAPKYRGHSGVSLCGILKTGETLEQWIKRTTNFKHEITKHID